MISVPKFFQDYLFIPGYFQTRNFNCTAAKVTEVKHICLPFFGGNNFCPWLTTKQNGNEQGIHQKLAWNHKY